MNCFKLLAAMLLGACSIASAQDVLLTGHMQRLTLLPPGAPNCPPVCPTPPPAPVNGVRQVCVSNAGGCQTMEVKVDHVYRGDGGADVRVFTSRIGEWGASFPVTAQRIAVSEEGRQVSWSLVTERDGKVFIDPKQMRRVGGVKTALADDGELVGLDEVLARGGAGR